MVEFRLKPVVGLVNDNTQYYVEYRDARRGPFYKGWEPRCHGEWFRTGASLRPVDSLEEARELIQLVNDTDIPVWLDRRIVKVDTVTTVVEITD